MSDAESVQKEREPVYGPWRWNMIGTAYQMAGQLINRFAAQGREEAAIAVYDLLRQGKLDDMATMFLDAVKSNRAASGNYHQDNFTDKQNYGIKFWEELQQGMCPMSIPLQEDNE